MIEGTVSDGGVPLVELELSGRRWSAIIDSGFNGDLELPTQLQNELRARFVGRITSLLAAGQTVEEDVFLIEFGFDGEILNAEATFAPVREILIGTGLLKRHRLLIDFPRKMVLLERVSGA